MKWLVLFSISIVAHANENSVLKCKPSQISPWPANAHVTITPKSDYFEMEVTSNQYGYTFEDKFHAQKSEGLWKEQPAEVYSFGENILSVSLLVGPKGREGFYQDKYGITSLFCN